ncbi:hypothetical protein LTR37_004879 [Vermiconidia calcicola]|uniref:Uncharacterized protein n=1 Tax=Vermiconidia calcicola TaxID=1690605 RepID=A0ACC3NKG7_9PEZI|nr:hypothetical protein LTR37_004879 [Vermiconidia calcicola]
MAAISETEGGNCERLGAEASQNSSTSLFAIPREIHDEVYKLLMVHTKEIFLDEMSRIRRLNYEQYPKAVENYRALALTLKRQTPSSGVTKSFSRRGGLATVSASTSSMCNA